MPTYEVPHGSDSEDSPEAPDDGGQRHKRRRRLHGACDACKRKKTKCDSAIMPDNICTNCISSNAVCAHTIPRQKKRDRQAEQIAKLEQKIRDLEGQLAATEVLSGSGQTSPSSFTETTLPIPQTLSSASSPRDDGEDAEDYSQLVDVFGRMSFDCIQDRFFGKASLLSFASEVVLSQSKEAGRKDPRRHTLWNLRSWERDYMNVPHSVYTFPEPDLLDTLLLAYEEWVHPQLPLLHWPSFLRDVRQQRHISDSGFGRVLLAACAVASRFVDDDRVLTIDPENPDWSGPSAGWKYLAQTPLVVHTVIDRVEIMDLQYYALTVFYFLGTSAPHTGWSLLGMAVRLAIDKGMHTEKGISQNAKTIHEHEYEKRVFWVLIALEWQCSAALGRPSCLHEEDIEVGYPIECDDEYWDTEVEDPSQAWKQPPGKPSQLAFQTAHIKLCEIAAFMLRTLYSSKKSKTLTGSISDSEQWYTRIVSELDSAMNRWKDNLPQHLRWDPTTPHTKCFQQQLLLHSAFYYLQIQIHRPFLKDKSPLSMPGLAICTNAARACSHLVAASLKRSKFASLSVITAAFAASTVLAINLWSRDRSVSYNLQKEIADIQRLFLFIKSGESRWTLACRLSDMLIQLFSLGDTFKPDQTNAPEPCRKRGRDGGVTDVSQAAMDPKQWCTSTQGAPVSSSANIGQAASQPQSQSQPAGDIFTDNAQFNWDWELSSLLFTQLGHANPNIACGGNSANPPNGCGSYEPGPSSLFQPEHQPQNDLYSGSSIPDPNAMAIWMNAPAAFSIEEWDSYLGSLANQPGSF
ncbi:fungal-specific transcription factor domain-containing protein [Coprinopsis sp. MPI-PUGE-AT-0042]|nr:fungal-specific transcription factor domain-containing protein [Coprinopsis sp. MPI-PUGE-AT-0042]